MRRWRLFVAGREIPVKKYVVRLSAEERERLEAMICAGKHPAQSLTQARILLKADVSEAGEGWSDSAISAALDISINNIGRTRRRLVEEGMAAALTRKYNPNSARPRIFDGAAEAKLIALTCSPAPEGFARCERERAGGGEGVMAALRLKRNTIALFRVFRNSFSEILDSARILTSVWSRTARSPGAARGRSRSCGRVDCS